MLAVILRNEVGWFDEEEHNSSLVAARLATDAADVKSAIAERISVILQNITSLLTSFIVAFVVEWRVSLLILATFPLLVLANFAQQLSLKGFAGDTAKAHAKTSMIAGEGVSNIRTVAAFNAQEKVLSLFCYELRVPQLRSLRRSLTAGGLFVNQGQIRIHSGGILWKKSGGGKAVEFDKDDIVGLSWMKIGYIIQRIGSLRTISHGNANPVRPNKHGLGVRSKDGLYYKFTGFRDQCTWDVATLTPFLQSTCGITPEEKQLSVSAKNWGEVELNDLCRNMLTFLVGSRQALEVSLADVSQTQLRGKNDVILEFHVDDTTDSLMEISFHIPNTNTPFVGDENCPARVFLDKIMSMADVGAGGEESVVSFEGIAILTPRADTMLNFIFHFCGFRGKLMILKFSTAVLFAFFYCPRYDQMANGVFGNHPETVEAQAIGLAKMQENSIEAITRRARQGNRAGESSFSHQAKQNPVMNPVRKELPKDWEEKKAKGLCFKCNEKYTRGHICKKKQLYALEVEQEDQEQVEDEGADVEEDQVPEEELQISLNALSGSVSYRTMRVKGNVKKKLVMILIDSGSTHNFLSPEVIKRVGIMASETDPLPVLVADGTKLMSTAICKGFRWEMQGTEFQADMRILQLKGCDMVLGIQWLATLGPVKWDFKNLSMEFQLNDRRHVLRGGKKEELTVIGANKMKKTVQKQAQGVVAQVYSFQAECDEMEDTLQPDLEALLADYGDIFQEPKTLPPTRSHDHCIPLKTGDHTFISSNPSAVAEVDNWIRERASILRMLKDNLHQAQHRMKHYADMHRSDREFEPHDWVVARIGKVAYQLQLPASAHIHPVFHVSLLKKKLGQHIVAQPTLPPVAPDGTFQMEPVAVLDRRMVKRNNRAVIQLLVQWSHSFPEDATWFETDYVVERHPVTRPGRFRSCQDGYDVKSSLKAEDRVLYPLEKGFFFLPKPPTLILHEEIDYVEFERHAAGGSNMHCFDLLIRLKTEKEHLFRNILRNEYHNLFDFIRKGLKIMNLGDIRTTDGVAAVLQSDDDDDDAVDPHLERIKNAAGEDESDEEDEDFVADRDDGGSPTDDSGEEESDASDIGGEKENIKKINPGIAFTDVGRVLGDKWKKITAAEKEPYEVKAQADKKRYKDEISGYKNPQPMNIDSGNESDSA
ncbi:unnamed protein product [Camellia sinensis]